MAAKRTPIDPASLADFNATLRHFVEELKLDMEMVTRQQIRLMCRDAMTFTPPMPKGGGRGLSVAAHKAGMNKLGNDVRRIFVPADSPKRGMPVLLRQIINSVRGNDQEGFRAIYDHKSTLAKVRNLSPVMRKIMEDSSYTRAFAKAQNYLAKANIFGQVRGNAGFTDNLRSIHDQYKGAVNGRWPKGARLGGPQYMVETTQQLEAYIAERQYKVGRVKAGWAAVMQQVPKPVTKKGVERNYGTYNAPWVDNNKRSAQGVFSASRSPGFVSMTVMNLIGNINNVAGEAGTENIVYGNRVKQMRTAVQEYFYPTIKKANSRKKK
jgi:hypothetical protein